MNESLQKLIEHVGNILINLRQNPEKEIAPIVLKHIILQAYRLGAEAHAEATKIDKIVGCEENVPTDEEAENCERCNNALYWDTVIDEHNSLSEQFFTSLTKDNK